MVFDAMVERVIRFRFIPRPAIALAADEDPVEVGAVEFRANESRPAVEEDTVPAEDS